jgi:membrane protease subunit HflK
MKRWLTIIILLAGLYAASGLYIVKGNEEAVVRRFGRLVTDDAGKVWLPGSGLHYDFPWPLAVIDRINRKEVRTLTIGSAELDETSGNLGDFLRSAELLEQSQFLTGDKNILNLQITLQYRISDENPHDFLYRSKSPTRHLQLLTEAAISDLVARSGVDFVHPLGLVELRELLTRRTRELAAEYRLGIDIDEAAISAVYPPPQVKQAFLEVSNARAEREQSINYALALAEELQAKAGAEAWQIRNEADIEHRRTFEEARGKADRFGKLIAGIESADVPDVARSLTMQRMYIETMEDILQSVKAKVYLDSGETVDLTIMRDPRE